MHSSSSSTCMDVQSSSSLTFWIGWQMKSLRLAAIVVVTMVVTPTKTLETLRLVQRHIVMADWWLNPSVWMVATTHFCSNRLYGDAAQYVTPGHALRAQNAALQSVLESKTVTSPHHAGSCFTTSQFECIQCKTETTFGWASFYLLIDLWSILSFPSFFVREWASLQCNGYRCGLYINWTFWDVLCHKIWNTVHLKLSKISFDSQKTGLFNEKLCLFDFIVFLEQSCFIWVRREKTSVHICTEVVVR